jgi:hypothetical protein
MSYLSILNEFHRFLSLSLSLCSISFSFPNVPSNSHFPQTHSFLLNSWLLCTFVMSAALLRHTYRYELFVYTHYLMALFFIFSFLHAFQSWYYTGAALLLYAFDKIIRLVNASKKHTISKMVHHADAGVTQISISGDTFK